MKKPVKDQKHSMIYKQKNIADTEYDTFAKYRGGWGGKVYKLTEMTGYDEKL